MSPSSTALAVIASIVGLGTIIGFCARGRHRMDFEQWTTGGRGFGLAIVWLLMAGEIYTAFSFLGSSGWVYSKGAPALYIIAYMTMQNVVAFYFAPAVWKLGKEHGLQTSADVFHALYGSKALAAFVAIVGIAAIIPYLQIQLSGLGIIVAIASFGGISQNLAMSVAAVLVTSFVLVSGIRAVAGISVLKDVLMIVVVVLAGIAIPVGIFGGIGPMFAKLIATIPGHLTMPGPVKSLGHGWFVTMVILSSAGQIVWPHAVASNFSAKSADTLRRNAIILPLYNLTIPFVFFVGFAALVALPDLAKGDLAYMSMAKLRFSPLLLGLVGGAGALAAIVPASIMLLTCGTLFAKNVVKPFLAPDLGDLHTGRIARGTVVILMAISLALALGNSAALASLLQLGYGIVGQFLPGITLGLLSRRVNAKGVATGMVAGLGILGCLEVAGRDPFLGMAAGFIGLIANFGTTIAVSRLCSPAGRRPATALAGS